eukprot:CAMPEP_0172538076 /NCGR_PEP_ID=MMETSP1067-20121228/9550_1 /TAXON_ID=265564 ORGANISM="Thalassiosira punctigera, Strain Tpunct2005C2" /NCGR_SAMPLE_ID=MMETSP1067 /ASSEMBLY_ACC=CAM_ASM_000444 /LENGTH=77 /DNA_ID=CAMNT_0013323497 /DNA_START=305 /DNA_END=538 /DNA_ORIENTATION=-
MPNIRAFSPAPHSMSVEYLAHKGSARDYNPRSGAGLSDGQGEQQHPDIDVLPPRCVELAQPIHHRPSLLAPATFTEH